MNERNNRKLDAMSHIDDELIEKSTQKRIFLLKRAKKRKTRRNIFISVGASAASFFMILGVILAVVLLFSNIPVYTGMTVSGEAPVAAVQETVAMPKVYPRTGVAVGAMRVTPFAALTGGLDLLSEETSDVFEETTDVFEETTDIFEEYTDIFEDHTDTYEETTDATEKRKIAYRATVGQDIYITIHIDNPENFAILQFTLNGKVYNSYMFEEGSDMENLVLKYNVGNEIGYFDYTIDAIKYVDGTEIKDVRMKGDRTITVAVRPEEMPTARIIRQETESEFDVAYGILVRDPGGLIERSKGKVYWVFEKDIGNGEYTELERGDISLDNRQSVTFEALEPLSNYRFLIIAEYEAFDGGEYVHILYNAGRRTGNGIKLQNIASEKPGTVSFELLQDIKSQATITKIELIEFGGDRQIMAEIPPDSRLFENIPWGDYRVRVTFEYKGIVRNIESDWVFVDMSGFALQGSQSDCTFEVYAWQGMEVQGVFAMIPDNEEGKIYSAMDGIVTDVVSQDYNFGARVQIKYEFNVDQYYVIEYFGLKSAAEGIAEGTKVSAGDVIGIAGWGTNNCSSHSHTHAHMWVSGWSVGGDLSLLENGYFYFTESSPTSSS